MVQYAQRTTKDGRVRAPMHMIGPKRVKGVPWPLQLAVVTVVGYALKKQYDKLNQVTPQDRFVQKIKIVPYGVLGTQLSMTGSLRQLADSPDNDTVIVDPAGLHHIKGTAANASGASGAIYKHIGLTGKFPVEIQNAIHGPTDAKFYCYDGGAKVIHAVGPDFREGEWSEREAAVELSRAYRNILHEFVMSEASTLRLLPVSSGIFSGPLYNQMAALTHEAISMGFDQLHPYDAQAVTEKSKNVELCIFMEREWDPFVNAFDLLKAPAML
jgi:hypothetical protein